MKELTRKAQGWAPVKQFAHKPKIRRNANRVADLQADCQELKMSPWTHVAAVKLTVDARRINWPGLIYMQQAYGVYDPKPRLVRANGSR